MSRLQGRGNVEQMFDILPDIYFYIKDHNCRWVMCNQACARRLRDAGAVVIGLDIDTDIGKTMLVPGAGAAVYSVSKAGLTQLMRVAALELAGEGITVNAVHPDAVFDTRLWTEETLAASAARYGLSVEEYKARNLLKTEIKSSHVAEAVTAFVDGTLPRTTGAQLPVDGGNERVI